MPAAPVATLSDVGADSRVTAVGKTTLAVVGGVPASKEIWIIADNNGFDPGGKTVFICLELAGTPKLASWSTGFPFARWAK